jgi:ubiquinone/menaquinone biosynthesis C-methylase UbiE
MLSESGPSGVEVTGVDLSAAMLQAAREHAPGGPRYVRADAHRLPFTGDRFDLLWIERTLVHLRDPRAALREARRVVAPGGRAMVAEADYRGLLVDCTDEETFGRVRERWLSRLSHPDVGRRLQRWLTEAGFAHVEVHPELRTFESPDAADSAFGLRRRSQEMVDDGSLCEDAAAALWRELAARHEAGCFFMAVPFVVAVAQA